MEPKAGNVPGTKELARLAAPRATSSRFGLIECPKRMAFCFADTMLSRKPTTAMILIFMINVKFQNVEMKIVHSGRCRSVQELEIRMLEWKLNK